MKKLTLSILAMALFLAQGAYVSAQQTLSVTVYNQDLALVHEARELEIAGGRSMVAFPDVSARLIPTSVQIRVVNAPQSLQILEQNFEYDLVSGQALYNKFLEKNIEISTKNKGVLKGQLLSSGGSDIVLQKEDGSIDVISREQIVSAEFPKLPEGLRSRPTLVWDVNNTGATKRKMEVSYLTNGLDWHAEYVGVLAPDEKSMEFNGWVAIENNSGITYKNAKLNLVAGDINLVARYPVLQKQGRGQVMMAEAGPPQFEEKAFFEYHLYTLQRPTTLKNNQKKQVSFFPKADVGVQKIYKYEGQVEPRQVSVLVEFKNDKAAGLGQALPAGKVRIYKADTDKALLFLGEDAIKHTPKNEMVRLAIGKAFDVIGERKKTEEKALGKRSREQSFAIELRNHKDQDVQVVVVERFRGDWEIRRSTLEPAKKDAERAEWNVDVPANGTAKLEFTVLMRW